MGLRLPLERNNTHMNAEFPDAYWRIEDFAISSGVVGGSLVAYPDKEARDGVMEDTASIGIGGAMLPYKDPKIYRWEFAEKLSVVFGESIPITEDAQKTAIYNWVKRYTGLPFEDVFEE